jgi:predicted NAD/FAD-binding protein
VAVVGSGIAGISVAWLLRDQCQVTLFERNDYFGGHTHTVVVDENSASVPVDTGFIVYNEPNYPHLTGLVDILAIGTRDTEMSFAASVGEPRLEYAGSDLDTLFAQRRNLINPGFLGMVWDILRFNRLCKDRLQTAGFGDLTSGDLLRQERLGEPRPESLVAEMTYHHPVFDTDAVKAQTRLTEIQGRDRIWYTGSYFGYGFHEDAVRASVELAERFGVRAPWLSVGDSRAARGAR